MVDDRIGGYDIEQWSTGVPIIPRVVYVTVASIPEGLEETLTQVARQHRRRLRLRVGRFGDREFVSPIGFIRVDGREPTDEDLRRLILLTIDQEQFALDVRQEAMRRLEAGEPPRSIVDWLSQALGFDDDGDDL